MDIKKQYRTNYAYFMWVPADKNFDQATSDYLNEFIEHSDELEGSPTLNAEQQQQCNAQGYLIWVCEFEETPPQQVENMPKTSEKHAKNPKEEQVK